MNLEKLKKDFMARSKGGKNAWKNVSKAERSARLSEVAKKRWEKIPKSMKNKIKSLIKEQ